VPEKDGYQVIGFSAAGSATGHGRDDIQGLFHGVIDLAPGGVGETFSALLRMPVPTHGVRRADGDPQVISPAASTT